MRHPSDMPRDLRSWAFETLLPFWADVGVDRSRGGFVERLAPGRLPADDDYKRIRVQARQIYTFSHAYVLGAPVWTLETARIGFDWLVAKGWNAEGGGWHHLLTRDGAPLDRKQDTYDHAFILMALAWLHRASGDRAPLDWARRTVDHLDRAMADPVHGGYQEHAGTGPTNPGLPRRQNPHMHLLEAFLAAHEATGETGWLVRARRIVELFLARFLDPAGTLGEYFTADWQPAPDETGRVREPGHQFEWVWLLGQYHRLSGDGRVLEPADRLYRFALDHGVDRTPGMVPAAFDEVDPQGRIIKDTKRLWPQTEAIKAHIVRAELQGDAVAAERAGADLAMLFTHYVDRRHAVWRDQLSRDGREVSTHIPASTLYHLFLCMAEAMRLPA
ncbi:MAG TPA: AGE family epimerase/isomerase [Alphaproteobacteria bacterium]|nr:AGE family epimerase/isomerase [Alphaproteobacteria bacterium]